MLKHFMFSSSLWQVYTERCQEKVILVRLVGEILAMKCFRVGKVFIIILSRKYELNKIGWNFPFAERKLRPNQSPDPPHSRGGSAAVRRPEMRVFSGLSSRSRPIPPPNCARCARPSGRSVCGSKYAITSNIKIHIVWFSGIITLTKENVSVSLADLSLLSLCRFLMFTVPVLFQEVMNYWFCFRSSKDGLANYSVSVFAHPVIQEWRSYFQMVIFKKQKNTISQHR